MGPTVDAVSFDRVSDLHEWEAHASSALYSLQMSAVGSESFVGSLNVRRVGNVTFAMTQAKPHRQSHGVRQVATADGQFGVSLQLQGSSAVTESGRTRMVETGDYVAYDTMRPAIRTFEEPSRTFVILFPRSLLRLPDRVLRESSALVMKPDSAVTSLAAEMLSGISRRLDALDAVAGYRVARSFIELLSASLVQNVRPETFAKDSVADRLRLSVLDYLADHITDHELSVGTIASHFYVSTRYVFQVFSDESRSLAQLIRDERLLLAESKLTDPSLRWASIAHIADLCGYVNANYFARVFKNRYGTTPSQYRDRVLGAVSETPSTRS